MNEVDVFNEDQIFNFIETVNLVQVFANEWCKSKNNILILGNCDQKITQLFKFIDCETFTIGFTNDFDFQVNSYTDLPFEKHTFDTIVAFCQTVNFDYLKPGGVVLIMENIVNAKEYYNLNGQTFSVI